MDFVFENVTLRRKNISMSNASIESFETSASDYPARSLPDLSAYNDNNKELKEEILTLKCQLESAHSEIENLILENNSLRKVNEEQAKNIEILSQITKNTPNKISKQNKTHKCSTPKIKQKKSNKNQNNTSTPTFLNLNSEDQTPKSNIICSGSNGIQSPCEKDLKSKKYRKYCSKNILCTPLNSSENTIQGSSTTQKNKIIILGDQKLRGLSTKLLKYKSDQFSVLSTIKPNAKSTDILGSFNDNSNLCNKDFAILGIGTNDSDPYSIFTHLCNTLDKLKNCQQVFLVKIQSNKYLNVRLLNYKLNLIAKQYNNCTFVDLDTLLNKYNHCTHKIYINCLYSKLKIEMDYQEYNSKFLSFSHKKINNLHYNETKINQINELKMTYSEYKQNLEKLVSYRIFNKMNDQSSSQTLKKGTIPYYFQLKSENGSKSIVSSKMCKKGTIPYYFNIKSASTLENIKTKSQFFRT